MSDRAATAPPPLIDRRLTIQHRLKYAWVFAFAQFAARWERLAVDLAALTTATQAALRVRQVATPACTG